jgi:hypothetical protein
MLRTFRGGLIAGLAVAALALLPAVLAVGVGGYDFDNDGTKDSLSIGGADLHGFVTGDPLSRADFPARLYTAPPAYVGVILSKAFVWDSRWKVEHWDPGHPLDVRVVRKADHGTLTVAIRSWHGWTRVSLSRSDSLPLQPETVDEFYQVLESLLFHGIPKPRTVT